MDAKPTLQQLDVRKKLQAADKQVCRNILKYLRECRADGKDPHRREVYAAAGEQDQAPRRMRELREAGWNIVSGDTARGRELGVAEQHYRLLGDVPEAVILDKNSFRSEDADRKVIRGEPTPVVRQMVECRFKAEKLRIEVTLRSAKDARALQDLLTAVLPYLPEET